MREFANVQRILGILVFLFSVTLLPPIGVALYYADGALLAFVEGYITALVVGLFLWFPVRSARRELRLRDGCLIVVLFWLTLSLFGALPLYFANEAWHTFTDAMFESMSGLTTTGSTAVVGLDDMPHAILYYRTQLQWVGGMGIIVLAVAVLPMLGVGGMQLYRAETPGPMKEDKLTPRITGTARALWLVYVSLTVLCALAYWLAGMGPFDAITHAFSTMATGGFSNYDASLAHFDSVSIETVAMVFMVVAGANFSLHFLAWHRGSARVYVQDPEFMVYLGLLMVLVLSFAGMLYLNQTYPDFWSCLRFGGFQIIAFGTSSGFTTAEYWLWPGALPVMLIISSAVCGSAGSTAGGIKVIRVLLLVKYAYRELLRMIHPYAEIPVKVGGRAVGAHVLDAVSGFFAVYAALFMLMSFILMTMGLDLVTAFSAVSATINNMGPGLGEVTSNFATIGAAPKWVCIFSMLVGRLEIFTLLAVLTPAFWRR
ncbi:MAG: potassium transporter TrkG [Nevskiales bacterium]